MKPGCQDDARWEYDQCIEAADERGRHERGNAMLGLSLNKVVGASEDERHAKNACEARRDAAIQLCLQKAGAVPR